MIFRELLRDNKELKNSLILLAIALIVIGSWFGYRAYTKNYEEHAHSMFALAMQEYNRAIQTDNLSTWKDVANAFEVAHSQYPKSNLAPYFLAYQSDALQKQGEEKKGLQAMNDAVQQLASGSPMHYLYKTKYALMQMDSKDKEVAAHGKELLEKLSQDNSNSCKEMALYYLGYDSFVNGQINDARSVWQKMLQATAKDSVWANAARSRLELLG